MTEPTIWNDWWSAEVYREFVEDYPLYPALNRHLAELADLRTARRVLDLGCGTGATTSACLEVLADHAEVVGLDSAPTMVEIARCRVPDRRARFLCADVTHRLSVAELGRFDRAVCNAALWLFPTPGSVLADLGDLLIPGGILVFNLPAERLEGRAVTPHPFQIELAASLAAGSDGQHRLTEDLYDPAGIEGTLERCGFEVDTVELYRHCGLQGELMALMQIPAMAARLVTHDEPAEGLRAVRSAVERSDPGIEVEVPWVCFVARRRSDSPDLSPSDGLTA